MMRRLSTPSSPQHHTGPAPREGPGRCFGAQASRTRAFTLTESLIASVVLAACVVGIGGTLGASYKNSARLDEHGVATALARQMLEEILSRKYIDGAGASDSIYDYRERSWTAASSFTTSDGNTVAFPGGGTYTRSSTVSYYDSVDDLEGDPEQSVSGSDPPPLAIVTVTVTTPGGKTITLSQLVAQK
jgi:type II secretory pathway pseudopilin PulG